MIASGVGELLKEVVAGKVEHLHELLVGDELIEKVSGDGADFKHLQRF